jgi:hypothetical protein
MMKNEHMIWTLDDKALDKCAAITICSDWAARRYKKMLIEEPLAVYGDLLPILQQSDFCAVNVETVLGNHGEPIIKGGPNIRADEKTVHALAPFHLACLANNHSVDYGADGLAYTMDVLKRAGIESIGAGCIQEEIKAVKSFSIKGEQVAFINCGEGEECRSVDGSPGVNGIDLRELEQQIVDMKKQDKMVIVIFHGGREHIPSPPPYIVSWLREIAAMGADAVIAHHPHVPQGYEMVGNTPVIYSQGNFVFWQRDNLYYHHAGYMVRLYIYEGCLRGVGLIPYEIKEDGLQLMSQPEYDVFISDLEELSSFLKDRDQLEELWNAICDDVGTDAVCKTLAEWSKGLANRELKSSALLHNVMFTQAHRELYLRVLQRQMKNMEGKSAPWAKDYVVKWKRQIE